MANTSTYTDIGTVVVDKSLRNGMVGITVVAGLSFVCTTFFFLYLFYKLLSWRVSLRDLTPGNNDGESTSGETHYSLGIQDIFASQERQTTPSPRDKSPQAHRPQQPPRSQSSSGKRNGPNQFFVLIIHLLIADILQSLGFFLDTVWLSRGKLEIGTPTCFAQGLFLSIGSLASSSFACLIAIHTYLALVWKIHISQRTLYTIIAVTWSFLLAVSLLPIAGTRNGANAGGYYVSAGAWCWVNGGYEKLRLLSHYLYIFVALFTNLILYILIVGSLHREAREAATQRDEEEDEEEEKEEEEERVQEEAATRMVRKRLRTSYSPVFFVYPIMYMACTLPLALDRLLNMAKINPPVEYLYFAGTMMAAAGFFDCILFSTTRRCILFGSTRNVNVEDVGIHTFDFMKTPANRRFGNMIWVQGGRSSLHPVAHNDSWWRFRSTEQSLDLRSREATNGRVSARGPNIVMNTVTSVMVEAGDLKDGNTARIILPTDTVIAGRMRILDS